MPSYYATAGRSLHELSPDAPFGHRAPEGWRGTRTARCVWRSRRRLLETGLQVPPPDMAAVGRGRAGSDAGLLLGSVSEGVARALRAREGHVPDLRPAVRRSVRHEL